MLRNKYWLMGLLGVAMAMTACGGDTVGGTGTHEGGGEGDETCTSGDCGDPETCTGDDCKHDEDACGGKCTTEETCVDGQCKPKSPNTDDKIPCGTVTCNKGQVCKEQHCYDPGDCDGIACENGTVCMNKICHESGDCGGLTCVGDEICHNDRCHLPGDCEGVECLDDESCYYDGCRLAGECGGVTCKDNEACYDETCWPMEPCGEVYCGLNDKCVDEVCVPSETCFQGKSRCGDACCGTSEFCGDRNHCCSREEATCGHDCCSESEVCEYEMCHIKCEDEHERCELADGSEMCCETGEICASNQCYKPSVSCIDNYMCENDEYCDAAVHTCLPQPKGEVCMASQKGGEVQPTLLWYWGGGGNTPEFYPDYVNVMSAPMVADINNDTVPEVVFNSWKVGGAYVGGGILRILNGKTGELLHSSNARPFTDGGSQVAIGKLYPNGNSDLPEALRDTVDVSGLQIVTCVMNGTDETKDFKIAAYNHEAKMIWMHESTYNECGQSGPGIADFNGDGYPEVFSRYNVYNGQTGELIARRSCGDGSKWHEPCDYPTVADLNGDTVPELVGGNAAYNVNFETHTLDYYYDRTADHIDGYPAVADIDNDGKPEIFVVRANNNTVMTFKYNGENYWDAPVPHTVGAGGPPTIANLDDTPGLELTFAGRYAYLALNNKGETLWTRSTHDWSSAKTGSSVFDFDGDGKAEVVYADEYFLRVYDGDSGDTRFCACNISGTHWEYPVIADVNDDDHAEIVVCSNGAGGCPSSLPADQGWDTCVAELMKDPNKLAGTHGVRVFSSPDKDWVNTRKIYNQHAYSITNVSDDGTIPRRPRQNWAVRGLNNFRLNMQPGATYLPKLKIDKISSAMECDRVIPLYFGVNNIGWATALSGVTVNVWASSTENGEYTKVGSVQTTKRIKPGEYEMLTYNYETNGESFPEMYFKLTLGDDAPVQCGDNDVEGSYLLRCASN